MTEFTAHRSKFPAFALALLLFGAASAYAGPNAFDITKVQPSFNGWDGTYNDILLSWTYNKYADPDNAYALGSCFYIDAVDGDEAGTFEDYAKNLKKKDWLDFQYVWTEISSTEKLPDGFVYVGKSYDYTIGGEKAELAFVLVRKFKNTYIKCRGTFENAQLLSEALAFCKALQ